METINHFYGTDAFELAEIQLSCNGKSNTASFNNISTGSENPLENSTSEFGSNLFHFMECRPHSDRVHILIQFD